MSKVPSKPLVFLSHSSKDRRELRALKVFLDRRAAGMVEFFLSSDDESIKPGSVWPTEVKKALDQMKLMFVFLSEDAIKSSWTYFEAGYGLCKLGVASVYCLAGTKHDSAPPPFNVLQNRNLHHAKDLTLLLKQCNQALGSRMDEAVSKAEFDQIFRRWPTVTIKVPPPFHEIVESIRIECKGRANSVELFEEVCADIGHRSNQQSYWDNYETGQVCNSVGVSLKVGEPIFRDLFDLFEIEKAHVDSKGFVTNCPEEFIKLDDYLTFEAIYKDESLTAHSEAFRQLRRSMKGEDVGVLHRTKVESINEKLAKANAQILRDNEARKNGPRECRFAVSSERVRIPIEIIDRWAAKALHSGGLDVEVILHKEIARERRVEVITSRLHGTEFRPTNASEIVWREDFTLKFGERRWDDSYPGKYQRSLSCHAGQSLSAIDLESLINGLWQAEILSRPKNSRR